MDHIQISSNCEIRSVIRFFFTEKGQNAIQIHCYGHSCTSLQMVRWRRTEFSYRRNHVHFESRSGRPPVGATGCDVVQLFAISSITTDDWRSTILSFSYPQKLKLVVLKFSGYTWKVVSVLSTTMSAVNDWLKEMVAERYGRGIKQLFSRYQKYIDRNGDYVSKIEMHLIVKIILF